MLKRNPILVTGSHRSGTTWVGKMLALSPSVGYIHEPFNMTHKPGVCGAKFDYWFTYITKENESLFYRDIENTLSFRYNLTGELNGLRALKEASRIFKEYKKFVLHRFHNARPLVKDPIAFFSSGWLAETFDMNVVVLIRHPAAFAGSLKKLNWCHDFSHFLKQPLLMRDHLSPFEDEIREYADHRKNIIDQAILLWKIFHATIIKYQDRHKDWIFLRHEDISREPLQNFLNIFNGLKLDFPQHMREMIQSHSAPSNPAEGMSYNHINLDSSANIWNWKNRLAESEIKHIRGKVEDLSGKFYSDADW